MALTVCRECQTPVSWSAKACPKCGADDPSASKATRIIGRIVGGVFALAFIAYFLYAIAYYFGE